MTVSPTASRAGQGERAAFGLLGRVPEVRALVEQPVPTAGAGGLVSGDRTVTEG